MQIPDKIKVGSHSIRVKIVDYEDIDNPGEYNNYTRIIRIRRDNGIPEDVKSEVFLHEIIEGLDKIYNLQLNHMVLTVLSEGLFQVMRDNRLDFRSFVSDNEA